MQFFVQKAVLDAGVKIVFAVVENTDNHLQSEEWTAYRSEKIKELLEKYQDLDVHADPILEGYNILHDNTGIKRRKNIPASENLIKLLKKNGDLCYINQAVDITLMQQRAMSPSVSQTAPSVFNRSAHPNRQPPPHTNIPTATIPTRFSAALKSVRWRKPKWMKTRPIFSISYRAIRQPRTVC